MKLPSRFVDISQPLDNDTMVDPPYRYDSEAARGNPMPTIDQMPLDGYFRPGVTLDFRHFDDGCVVTAADIQSELARIEYALQPLDIVLVNTRAGERHRSLHTFRL